MRTGTFLRLLITYQSSTEEKLFFIMQGDTEPFHKKKTVHRNQLGVLFSNQLTLSSALLQRTPKLEIHFDPDIIRNEKMLRMQR